MQPKNYLNNKDILKEIHKCKNTYCSFTDPKYEDYDLILRANDDILANLEEGRHQRATRLNKLAVINHTINSTEPLKILTPDDIDSSDVIFRIMTWDHIPEMAPAPAKVKAKKKAVPILDTVDNIDSIFTEYDIPIPEIEEVGPKKHQKVNFPPFQHFRVIDVNGTQTPVCVGKSHWTGDLSTGHFSAKHGRTTNELAKMYMKICERYASRPNWRGYSYNDEMRAQAILQLTMVGLQFDESKSENPFGFWTVIISNSFSKVWNIEKQNQNIRDDILEMNNLAPSYTRQGSTGSYVHESIET
jgi:hypothetical protein